MAWGNWLTPVVGLANLLIVIAVGLAVWGHVKWRALEEYEKLSEARLARIEDLERQLREEREARRKETEFSNSRITALEAQVAELQRLNQNLQKRWEKEA